MKFYNLPRKERRKLKNQFDKTILGCVIKDVSSIFMTLSVIFLASPLILCLFMGFDAIGVPNMLIFLGFFLVFTGIFCCMCMFRYVLLKEFYDDKNKEKNK